MAKVFIGSDRAGFEAKGEVTGILASLGLEVVDLGTHSPTDKVDYPVYAKLVCDEVMKHNGSFGILICGSGTGMQIAANKIEGIRAAFAYDEYSAKMARYDNDANVLTLRAREFDHSKYKDIVSTFLMEKFSGIERHQRRIEKIHQLE